MSSNAELNKLTKDSLAEAVWVLSKNKPINKITIKELCEKAGVSRNGFYRNFYTIEDVIKYYIDNVVTEDIFKITIKPTDNRDYIIGLFEHYKRHYAEIKIILKNNLSILLIEAYDKYVCFPDINEEYRGYFEAYKSGAIFFTMLKWIKNDMTESPEEMSDIILQIKKDCINIYKSEIT